MFNKIISGEIDLIYGGFWKVSYKVEIKDNNIEIFLQESKRILDLVPYLKHIIFQEIIAKEFNAN